MPFAPLPTTFLKSLHKLAGSGAAVLDLGCGEGSFTELIQCPGVHLFGLDNSIPSCAQNTHVLGNALMPPILPGSIDLLLASNLVRHLLPSDPKGRFLKMWQDLLKPGGMLVVFEDEPAGDPQAVRNYRDVQLFLARLVGVSRGPLLSSNNFLELVSTSDNPKSWEVGLEKNSVTADVEIVLGFLAGSSGQVSVGVEDLMQRIKNSGLEYGHYWWAKWEKAV